MVSAKTAKTVARDALAEASVQEVREPRGMMEAAVRRGDVLLAFQPVVEACRPDRIAFHEGLIRVVDDSGRIIPAHAFIEAVEPHESGRVLDRLALDIGLRTLEAVSDLRLSINMSARTIGDRLWMQTLEAALARDRTVGERLILEITEGSAMSAPERVVDFMKDLHQRGIAFALDDFGAGYTAFRHFRDFSFDILKIDGQFIRGIHADTDNQVLTRALLSIARQFDLMTVAEKVETAADAAFLEALGVDCLQGFLYGAPTFEPPWARDGVQRLA